MVISAAGTRAHSARSWLGDNAIHKLGDVLDRLSQYQARSVDIDGCAYREGLSAVRIDGGIAGNVIPDAATVTVNFRFAPDRTVEQAIAHVHEVFDGLDVGIELTDSAAGALPGLTRPAAAARWSTPPAGRSAPNTAGPTCHDSPRWAFPRSTTDPGDPNLAHRVDEHVEVAADHRGHRHAAAVLNRLTRSVPWTRMLGDDITG